MAEDSILLSQLLSMFSSSIFVPTEFHEQARVIKQMLGDDLSGLITSLIDYYINTSSSIDFEVHSGNDSMDKILNMWLDDINSEFNGLIPSGVNSLAEEYFKERWAGSSFICLKILDWKIYRDDNGNSLSLPNKMAIVDGSMIYVDDKYLEQNNNIVYINKPIDYYLGQDKQEKLDKAVFLSKPFDRWFSIYPVPFLIRRGVYHNYEILKMIKDKQSDVLVKIIGYILMVKRGTESLLMKYGAKVLDDQLAKIKDDLQKVVDNLKTVQGIPMRITMFDEKLEHLIPDFEKFLRPNLTSAVEKSILSGLGWIDVPDSAMSSRRESIVNPKSAIEEIKKGIKDFKSLLGEVIKYSLKQNKDDHFKFASKKPKLFSSEVNAFITDDMRDHLRSLYDRGILSRKTYLELVGNGVYVIEKFRKQKEIKDGDEILMYPPIIRNMEADESLTEILRNQEYYDIEDENKTEDKKGIEKDNYYMSFLEGAPYKTVKELPKQVKNVLKDIKLQRIWLEVFNFAYDEYSKRYNKKMTETIAFKVAWSVIKKIAIKTKNGWKLKGGNNDDK